MPIHSQRLPVPDSDPQSKRKPDYIFVSMRVGLASDLDVDNDKHNTHKRRLLVSSTFTMDDIS